MIVLGTIVSRVVAQNPSLPTYMRPHELYSVERYKDTFHQKWNTLFMSSNYELKMMADSNVGRPTWSFLPTTIHIDHFPWSWREPIFDTCVKTTKGIVLLSEAPLIFVEKTITKQELLDLQLSGKDSITRQIDPQKKSIKFKWNSITIEIQEPAHILIKYEGENKITKTLVLEKICVGISRDLIYVYIFGLIVVFYLIFPFKRFYEKSKSENYWLLKDMKWLVLIIYVFSVFLRADKIPFLVPEIIPQWLLLLFLIFLPLFAMWLYRDFIGALFNGTAIGFFIGTFLIMFVLKDLSYGQEATLMFFTTSAGAFLGIKIKGWVERLNEFLDGGIRLFWMVLIGTILGILFWISFLFTAPWLVWFRIAIPVIWSIYFIIVFSLKDSKGENGLHFTTDLIMYFFGNILGTALYFTIITVAIVGRILYWLVEPLIL